MSTLSPKSPVHNHSGDNENTSLIGVDSIPSSPSMSSVSGVSFVETNLVSNMLSDSTTKLATVNGFDIEDGNLLIKTESTIHRIHWSLFKRHSIHFQDLYSTSHANGTLNNIVSLDDVSAKDFFCLLTIIYPSDFSLCSLITKDDWVSVLHLAHELRFTTIRELAIRMLFPLASPVDRIVFGHRYALPDWLLDAYVAVCERDELLTVEEGERLGVRDAITINRVHHEIHHRAMSVEEVRYTVWRACCPSLEVPELAEMHAERLREVNAASTDRLLAAQIETARRRQEAEKKSAMADRARGYLEEAMLHEETIMRELAAEAERETMGKRSVIEKRLAEAEEQRRASEREKSLKFEEMTKRLEAEEEAQKAQENEERRKAKQEAREAAEKERQRVYKEEEETKLGAEEADWAALPRAERAARKRARRARYEAERKQKEQMMCEIEQ